MTASSDSPDADPAGPSLQTPFHVQDRNLTAAAGAKKGWRNASEHVLEKAFFLQKIGKDEYAAGNCYRAFFEMMGKTGRDSTQFSIVGSGSRVPFTDSQTQAIRAIEQFESYIDHARSVAIVRKFCGEGWGMLEAAVMAGYDKREAVHRLRIALNKLAMAIASSHVDFRLVDRH